MIGSVCLFVRRITHRVTDGFACKFLPQVRFWWDVFGVTAVSFSSVSLV